MTLHGQVSEAMFEVQRLSRRVSSTPVELEGQEPVWRCGVKTHHNRDWIEEVQAYTTASALTGCSQMLDHV